MSEVRSVHFAGETIEFWLAAADPLLRLPAVHASWSLGGAVVEDPASRGRMEDYSDQELLTLWRSKSRFSAW